MTKTQEFRQSGSCPKCGAPIYVDANLTKGKNGEILTVLPTPHYTCVCRITGSTGNGTAGNGGNGGYYPNPVAGWVPPPYPFGGENINVLDDGHQNNIFKQFCGSGGVLQDPNLRYVVLYTAR